MKKYDGITTLVEQHSQRMGMTKKSAEAEVKAVLDTLMDVLLDSEDGLQLVDFLTLQKVTRKPRVGRNPKNPTEVINIPEKVDIKAIVGKRFSAKLNEK